MRNGITMFVKIFSKIFDSSIAENWRARVTFMDLLILADRDGVVDMTLEAIARRTNTPIDFLREGIAALSEPDPKSRTESDDGRRIELIDEHRDWGWKILNYTLYRDLKSSEQMRAANRARVAKCRARKAGRPITGQPVNGSESKSSANVMPNVMQGNERKRVKCHAEAEANSEADPSLTPEQIAEADAVGMKIVKTIYDHDPAGFIKFWEAYPKKVGKGVARQAWKKAKCETFTDKILATLNNAKASFDWKKEGGAYIPHPATWLNREGWEDDFSPASPTVPPKSASAPDPKLWIQYQRELKYLQIYKWEDATEGARLGFKDWLKEQAKAEGAV